MYILCSVLVELSNVDVSITILWFLYYHEMQKLNKQLLLLEY